MNSLLTEVITDPEKVPIRTEPNSGRPINLLYGSVLCGRYERSAEKDQRETRPYFTRAEWHAEIAGRGLWGRSYAEESSSFNDSRFYRCRCVQHPCSQVN